MAIASSVAGTSIDFSAVADRYHRLPRRMYLFPCNPPPWEAAPVSVGPYVSGIASASPQPGPWWTRSIASRGPIFSSVTPCWWFRASVPSCWSIVNPRWCVMTGSDDVVDPIRSSLRSPCSACDCASDPIFPFPPPVPPWKRYVVTGWRTRPGPPSAVDFDGDEINLTRRHFRLEFSPHTTLSAES